MRTLALFAAALLFPATGPAAGQEKDGWISLFNGKDLDGWKPKITGFELGENALDTYRVEDGVLKVCYDKYTKFEDKFGHIFYKEPFSHYVVRFEYRFTGAQCPGGPGWAFRNSGIMVHCQPPETMDKKQNFPVSIEVQLLGGKETGERSTGNLCTPGTHVVMDGKLETRHCINSKSKTFRGDDWVTCEVEVRGSKSIVHKINGEVVLSYSEPQYDEKDNDAKKLIKDGKKLIEGGYLSLQAESHPVEFRKIELKKLDPQ